MKTKMKIKTILLFIILFAIFYLSYFLIYIISYDCYEQYEQVNRFSPSTKYLELPIPLPRVNIPVPICLLPIYNIVGSVVLLSSLVIFKISIVISVLMSLWICSKFVNNEKLNQKLEIKKRLSWKKYIIAGIGIMWFVLIIIGNIIAIDRSKIVGNYDYQVFRNRILRLEENIISKEDAIKIANEMEAVNKFLELYPNIEPSVNFKGYSGNPWEFLPGAIYKFITNAWYIVFETEFEGNNLSLEIIIDTNGEVRYEELICKFETENIFNFSTWYIIYNEKKNLNIIDLFSDKNFCDVGEEKIN